ncbi:MAG: hypothetical protein WBC87_03985, partial [Pseudolabrys sp.]
IMLKVTTTAAPILRIAPCEFMTSPPKNFLAAGLISLSLMNKPSLSDPHRSVFGGNYSAQFVVLPMPA